MPLIHINPQTTLGLTTRHIGSTISMSFTKSLDIGLLILYLVYHLCQGENKIIFTCEIDRLIFLTPHFFVGSISDIYFHEGDFLFLQP
jgi:hypothetical protein